MSKNVAPCPIAVAAAAPFIPQPQPKINTGSRIIFTTAPVSIATIAHNGLPSARITEFIILHKIKIGNIASTIFKYSTASPIVFSDAPNKSRIGLLSGYTTATINSPQTKETKILPPTATCAFSGLLRPWHIFKYAAQPSPKHQANACAMIKIGNTTPVAAFPKVPNSLFPIKIWSTILYSELINKDKIHGIENFNINLLMRPFPKSRVSFVFIINPFAQPRV